MKERILTGWSAQRWLHLAFAIAFLIAGITGHEPVAFVAAAFFGAQALFNMGCCGMEACAPRRADASATNLAPKEITYEEMN